MRSMTLLLGVCALSASLALCGHGEAENLGSSSDPGLKVKDCKYGPDTCLGGFVWRGATAADHVCVTPQARDATKADNALAASRRSANGGPYGPDTCKNGFVWRGATATDHVCVTPRARDAVAADNRAAASRKACV